GVFTVGGGHTQRWHLRCVRARSTRSQCGHSPCGPRRRRPRRGPGRGRPRRRPAGGTAVSRLFGRGQLKQALLQVAAELGPANGYTIMQALDERVGGSWRPSPGAIYPALLALEDAGLLQGREDDGTRLYEVTARGRASLEEQPDVVQAAAARSRRATP